MIISGLLSFDTDEDSHGAFRARASGVTVAGTSHVSLEFRARDRRQKSLAATRWCCWLSSRVTGTKTSGHRVEQRHTSFYSQ